MSFLHFTTLLGAFLWLLFDESNLGPRFGLGQRQHARKSQLQLSNSTVYSTHPQISYSQCTHASSQQQHTLWEPIAYRSSQGTLETFFRTTTPSKDKELRDCPRHIEFEFKGSALYLYIPSARYVKYPRGRHQICLDTRCTTVNAGKVYDASRTLYDEPVLLWSRTGLDHSKLHKLQLSLLAPNSPTSTSEMAFHHLVYSDVAHNDSLQWKLEDGETLINVTYSDTYPRISYSTPKSPKIWEAQVVSNRGYNESFHSSTILPNQHTRNSIREVRWEFRGASVAIYGAPKDQLLHTPVQLELCLEEACYLIDSKRIYNNVGSPHLPVLLYRHTGLHPANFTRAILRSLPNRTPIQQESQVITLFKYVVEEVRKSRPSSDRTATSMTQIRHRFLDTDSSIQYHPASWCINVFQVLCARQSPWNQITYVSNHGANRTYHRALLKTRGYFQRDHIRISMSIPRGASSIELYGAPRSQIAHPHGSQEVCLGKDCYPIDFEQAYLNIPPHSEDDPVLVWSTNTFDSEKKHTLTVKLVDDTIGRDRVTWGMTFSELVYWEEQKSNSWTFTIIFVIGCIIVMVLVENPSPKKLKKQEEEVPSSCIVCWDKEACFSFVPCGHLCICGDCSATLRRTAPFRLLRWSTVVRCPVCAQDTTACLRIYKP